MKQYLVVYEVTLLGGLLGDRLTRHHSIMQSDNNGVTVTTFINWEKELKETHTVVSPSCRICILSYTEFDSY